jgi:hypothetical protein
VKKSRPESAGRLGGGGQRMSSNVIPFFLLVHVYCSPLLLIFAAHHYYTPLPLIFTAHLLLLAITAHLYCSSLLLTLPLIFAALLYICCGWPFTP